MPFTKAGQLTRMTPTARADDTLGLVAENLRASPHGVLPVLDRTLYEDSAGMLPGSARVLGLICENDLARVVMAELNSDAPNGNARVAENGAAALTASNGVVSSQNGTLVEARPLVSTSMNGHSPAKQYSERNARSIMRGDSGIVPAAFSLHNALLTLQRYDLPALPVVDEAGNYRGMISRADVVAALEGTVRPPLVGGMATPLGVWLTTGHISAGSSALGLFLSGALLSLCLMTAHWIMLLALAGINRDWAAIFVSARMGVEMSAPPGFDFLALGAEYLLFLVLLRALPLAGVHAAEHQTVWAIEKGLPLTVEHVEKMPRAHPRCGPNLAVLAGLLVVCFQHLPMNDEGSVIFVLLFIFLVWRFFGRLMQEWFTTKPATKKQLEGGIASGKALLEKYQAEPHLEVGFGQRVFNSGIIMVALGMFPTMILLGDFMEKWMARWILSM